MFFVKSCVKIIIHTIWLDKGTYWGGTYFVLNHSMHIVGRGNKLQSSKMKIDTCPSHVNLRCR